MNDILINYRRIDSEIPAHVIYDIIKDAFPDRVFIDIDKIPPSAEFPDYLTDVINKCTVVLAVIGQHWLTAADAHGRRRLDDPSDWVRRELEIALARKPVSIIPVLLNGTKMPAADALPPSLQTLTTRQAFEPATRNFGGEIKKLIPDVRRLLEEADARRKVFNRADADELIPGESFRDSADLPSMVVIPQNYFVMGSRSGEKGHRPAEAPRRKVKVGRRFAASLYPVTIHEWNAAVDGGLAGCERIPVPSTTPSRPEIKLAIDFGFITVGATFDEIRAKIYPATGITWEAAKAYCAWASDRTGRVYRLLSEAEWEYCCRAGSQTPFATGSLIGFEHAHYNRRLKYKHQRRGPNPSNWPANGPRPSAMLATNAFGICGMHGNVWEWVEDCFHDSYQGAPANSRAWVDDPPRPLKVVRGGCFASGVNHLRSAARGQADIQPRDPQKFGLRVACNL